VEGVRGAEVLMIGRSWRPFTQNQGVAGKLA
jgi:hypothetical protein